MNNQSISAILFFLLIGIATVGWSQTTTYEIYEIQGEGLSSPLFGERVHCENNIITAAGINFFFLQTPDARDDQDPLTSNGILLVYSGPRPDLEVGDLISLEGVVQEWNQMTRLQAVTGDIVVTATDRELPAAICLEEDFPGKIPKAVPDLERVEGMRICMDDGIVCSPANSRNAFYLTAAERAFREPGIEYPGEANLPVWDGNPELFYCEPFPLLSSTADFAYLPAGSRMDATGFIHQADDDYTFWPQTYSLRDQQPQTRGVRPLQSDELSIASTNLQVFSDDEPIYPIQLQKAARYIVELMQTPDVVALQEVENLKVVVQLIAEIQALSPGTDYRPFVYVANDFINTAYLISPAIKNVRVRALGESQRLSTGGRLHDRPPLLLEADVLVGADQFVPIKALNLHLRSLIGIEGGNAREVRRKRHEAAISVARMVQSIGGPNLFVTGDFNAYPFTDGYVDVLAQITGQNSLGAEYPVQPIVDPPLSNLTVEELPKEEQYSYIFRGNAQMLDHFLASDLDDMTLSEIAFIRGNADNVEAFRNDASVLYRVSDHDAIVTILRLPGTVDREFAIPTPDNLAIRYPNPFFSGDRITVELPVEENIHIRLFSMDGKLLEEIRQVNASPGTYQFELYADYLLGIYVLEISGRNYQQREKLFIGR